MKLKPIYNDSTNSIIYDYIVYMEQNDLPEFINIESLDLPHFIGKIQHQQKEIQRLNNIINKTIEYIHNHQIVFELSGKKQIQEWFEEKYYVDLLNILKGEDKK